MNSMSRTAARSITFGTLRPRSAEPARMLRAQNTCLLVGGHAGPANEDRDAAQPSPAAQNRHHAQKFCIRRT